MICRGKDSCGRDLPPEAFARNTASPGGRFYICRECSSKRSAAWRARNPRSPRQDWFQDWAKHLRRKYGLTPSAWTALLIAYRGRCGLCHRPFYDPEGMGRNRHPLSPIVDHNHETGEIRGMLHNACNRTIGAMGDTREGVAEFAVLADAYLAEGGETATTALAAGPAYQHRPIRSAEPLALPI